MITILTFIITIFILVTIHEFGHYYVAVKSGVFVEEFSIGFGKTLFQVKDKKGTKWKISLIPLGGYVKMHGENADVKGEGVKVIDPNKSFSSKSPWVKMLIVIAGPLANFLFALMILTSFYFLLGKKDLSNEILEVLPNTPAARAKLLPGDQITEVAGITTSRFSEIYRVITLYPNQEISLKILREQEALVVNIIPEGKVFQEASGKEVKMGFIGIKPNQEFQVEEYDLFGSLIEGGKEIWVICKLTITAIKQLITGDRSMRELNGPIKIAEYSERSFSVGIISYVWFLAMLSINLGLINLLPIPMLDGGHFVFYAYEAIFGKPINISVQNLYYKFGLMILIFIIVISLSNDIKDILLKFS